MRDSSGKRKATIIGVPMDLGAGRRGVGLFPLPPGAAPFTIQVGPYPNAGTKPPMAKNALPLLKRVTCPHCWTAFPTEEILWVSAHADLLGDPRTIKILVHRGGLRADILEGGKLRVGDAVG